MPPAVVISDQRSDPAPLVSFLVPVYNERATVVSVLDAVARFPEPHEIIVVDDGSTDGTRDLLAGPGRPGRLVLFHERNGGKGDAVRTGLGHARGRYVAIQDADLEYDPLEYAGLLGVARAGNLSAVFGSRFLRPNPSAYRRYAWGNRVLTAWINLLTGARITDAYTCFKLVDRDRLTALRLSSRGFELEAEICVKLARRGIPIREIPITYRPRRIEEGKKIGAADALQGFWTALKERFKREPDTGALGPPGP